ncbi:MAG: phage replisome organizer N-terminal domain-containing protein [Solibacillus isronensis]
MAEIRWIKLTVNMFDDEKIRLIQAMPEADAIIIIWIRLLTLAGKTNSEGQIFITENMPYNDEMLATLFNKPVNTIRLAIETLRNFGMIDLYGDGTLAVINWEKHQNVDAMEKMREQERLRKQRQRERQKQLELPMSRDSHGTVTGRHATDIEEDIDKNIYMSGKTDNIPFKEIIDFLNQKADTNFRHSANKNRDLIKARFNEGFTLDDFKTVIEYCCKEWKGVTFTNGKLGDEYLQPSTLFNNKFDERLNKAKLDVSKSQKQQLETKAPSYVNEMSENDLLNMGE